MRHLAEAERAGEDIGDLHTLVLRSPAPVAALPGAEGGALSREALAMGCAHGIPPAPVSPATLPAGQEAADVGPKCESCADGYHAGCDGPCGCRAGRCRFTLCSKCGRDDHMIGLDKCPVAATAGDARDVLLRDSLGLLVEIGRAVPAAFDDGEDACGNCSTRLNDCPAADDDPDHGQCAGAVARAFLARPGVLAALGATTGRGSR